MNKINGQTATAAGAVTAGAVLGAMVSRIAAEKIPLKNEKIKRGALAAAGLVGAILADSKTTTGKFLLGATSSVAGTQIIALLKSVLNTPEKQLSDGLLKTALGEPDQTVFYYPPQETPVLDNPYGNFDDTSFQMASPLAIDQFSMS